MGGVQSVSNQGGARASVSNEVAQGVAETPKDVRGELRMVRRRVAGALPDLTRWMNPYYNAV